MIVHTFSVLEDLQSECEVLLLCECCFSVWVGVPAAAVFCSTIFVTVSLFSLTVASPNSFSTLTHNRIKQLQTSTISSERFLPVIAVD